LEAVTFLGAIMRVRVLVGDFSVTMDLFNAAAQAPGGR
jgi:hypothetical protein